MSSSPTSRRSRPTSAPTMDDSVSSSSSSLYMQRSSSADPGKISKRKGTRSVSTLTAAQLARKRANDREAQRAIRARTKEHIERLEAELDELRSSRHRDPAVQELMRRNRMLEDELKSLRESMGIAFSSSPSFPTTAGAVNSPRTSPYPPADYANSTPATSLPDYASGFVAYAHPAPISHAQGQTPSNCENWADAVSASIPSNVSSPSSSVEEYTTGPAYIPTSAPNPMVQSPPVGSLRVHDEIKMEYEDGNDHGFPLENQNRSHTGTPGMSADNFMIPQHPPSPWGAQHSGIFYVPVQSPVY